jgi:hypothetical protein
MNTETEEFHDYLKSHNNSRGGRYHLSVDSEGRSTGAFFNSRQKDLAYRLTAEAYGAGIAEYITLTEMKGEDGWDIFRWSHRDEELEETDPALRKLLDAQTQPKKRKATTKAVLSGSRARA